MKCCVATMKVSVIVPCGGSGSRCGWGYNKLLEPLLGDALITHTLRPFIRNSAVSQIILPCSSSDINSFDAIIALLGDSRIITTIGGESRAYSVYNALKVVDHDTDIVIVHDGARPYLADSLLSSVINHASSHGSAVAAIKVTDTLCYAHDGIINGSALRDNCYRVQTPQAYAYTELLSAYAAACAGNQLSTFTDESTLMRAYGHAVHLIDGDENNIKITYSTDFQRVIGTDYRVGCGYDTHKLVTGRKLVLGGIELAHDKGLLGHSDADVLIHAIMDALLSCAGQRDIGVLFPDSDATFKDIDSKILLLHVASYLRLSNLDIVNISAVIMAEKPKLMHHITLMTACIADVLGININQINISATTCEGIGLVGREEGISSRAIALCRTKRS